MNRRKRISPLGVATRILTIIPRRLLTLTVGVSGVGFAAGVIVGALGYRAISKRTQANANDVDPNSEPSYEANYEAWTKAKLYELATELDLSGRGDMSKDELVDAVRSAAA